MPTYMYRESERHRYIGRSFVAFWGRFHIWLVRWSEENHTATRLTFGPWVRKIKVYLYRERGGEGGLDVYVEHLKHSRNGSSHGL